MLGALGAYSVEHVNVFKSMRYYLETTGGVGELTLLHRVNEELVAAQSRRNSISGITRQFIAKTDFAEKKETCGYWKISNVEIVATRDVYTSGNTSSKWKYHAIVDGKKKLAGKNSLDEALILAVEYKRRTNV